MEMAVGVDHEEQAIVLARLTPATVVAGRVKTERCVAVLHGDLRLRSRLAPGGGQRAVPTEDRPRILLVGVEHGRGGERFARGQ